MLFAPQHNVIIFKLVEFAVIIFLYFDYELDLDCRFRSSEVPDI